MSDPALTSPPLALPPTHPRRLVFLGTPALAVGPLRALHGAGYDMALVVSRADTRRGRGGAILPSPVKAAAIELGIPVSDRTADALGLGADLGVVVAFGRIIPRSVLEQVPMVNLHFSLLPRWRGAAPVERALLAGDEYTGVDLMAVEEGLDVGGIYAEHRVRIDPDESADELRVRLAEAGAALLLASLAEGIGAPRPQEGEPVYAEKLAPAELEIDWSEGATKLRRLVQVGGAWTTFRGKRLKVWRAAPVAAPEPESGGWPGPGVLQGLVIGAGTGALELVEVQAEGRTRQSARDWANGVRPGPGERLGA
jgi:methionyl-tRNA formyltransferase